MIKSTKEEYWIPADIFVRYKFITIENFTSLEKHHELKKKKLEQEAGFKAVLVS